MGLDLYDLVLAIEKEFDVTLTEEDAQSLLTVGDLYEFILTRTKTDSIDNFLSIIVLGELKTGLKACEITEKTESDTPIDIVLPETDRQLFWQRLSKKMNRKLPKLVRPKWVCWLNILVTIGLSISVFCITTQLEDTGAAAPLLGIMSLFVFGHLSAGATQKLATEPDPDLKTIGDLSERIVGLNYQDLKDQHGSFGKQDVWIVLKEILVDCLGVDHDEVIKEARLVEDLGCE